ncbi:MAG: LssY C-terminal domain-containing protein [Gemmatimonadota bacterium]|nr:MAG: LssY C-terminal domain-containing protein [Gemmatimonadota bacterium]
MMALKKLLSRPRSLWLRLPIWIVAVWLLLTTGRFLIDLVRPYQPEAVDDVAFLTHAQTQRIGPVRVTAAALSPTESRAVFGTELALNGIQPVWLAVENGDSVPLFYLQAGTDPEWFSPYEAYWLSRLRAPRKANQLMESRFYELHFENPVFPGQTHSGFIYTRLDEGVKALDLDLVAIGEVMYNFTFSVQVPGFRSDYSRVDFDTLYPVDSLLVLDTEEELQGALEQLPCCATNRAGDEMGDPLNVVLIGDPKNIFPALSRRGWHPTEQTYHAAVWRTIRSFLFRSSYRYSPVSPLYAFGRRQDIAGQKARGTIHLRNHARFWLTPIRFRGSTVWLGQISRDIGVRFILGFPPTTHKIDPDVDEARTGLIQDLAYSQALARFAFVKGVGVAPRDNPRDNLTGDPYFTDGLRAVLFFEARPRTLNEVELLDWELPPRFQQYGELMLSRGPWLLIEANDGAP